MNNGLKLNVDKQQDEIKEHCDMDDEYEIQETTTASNPMKNIRTVCLTCNQTFAMENWFKKHIQEEHKIPCKDSIPL